MRSSLVPTFILAVALGASVVAAGCVGSRTAIPSDEVPSPSVEVAPTAESSGEAATSTATPAPTAPTVDDSCVVYTAHQNHVPFTIANLSGISAAIVVADVVAVKGGRWNTGDGKRPLKANAAPLAHAQTDYVLKPTRAIQGPEAKGALVVAVNGGVLDEGTPACARWDFPEAPDLEKGLSYVVFLGTDVNESGKKVKDRLVVLDAWPIGSTGGIVTSEGDSMTVDELQAAIGAASKKAP
jgi:hypothetical protein